MKKKSLKEHCTHVEALAMQMFTISRLQERVCRLRGLTFVAKKKKKRIFKQNWSQSHFEKALKSHSNVRRLLKHDRLFWILRYVFYGG